jgi:hypothetical protein
LSEVLRLAADEGPQRIGRRTSFVVVPETQWRAMTETAQDRPSMGEWLLTRMPRGAELSLPSRAGQEREIPFFSEGDR